MSLTLPTRSASLTLAFVVAFATFLSCQNDASTNSPPSGPFVVSQVSPMDSIRMPDSATWSHNGSTGSFTLSHPGAESFKLSASFPNSIANDTLVVGLWTLGLRTTLAPSVVQPGGGLAVISTLRSIDSSVVKLLLSFDSLRETDHSRYGNSSDPIAKQIQSLQMASAVLVLGKSLSISALPTGLDSSAVLAQVLVIAASSGKNIAVIAKLTGLDTASLKPLVEALLQGGVLKASDSAALYPPYPVRVKTALVVGSTVEAGGATVAVQGMFAWTKGHRITNPKYEVRTPKGIDSSFQFLHKALPQGNDTTWNLSGNFSLQAPSSASAGIDTLIVTLSDDSGYVATARAAFTVVARDTSTPVPSDSAAPVVKPQSTTRDTSVSWSTSTYSLAWSVTDDSALGAVTLNDSALTGKDGLYQKTVSLKVGRDSFRLVAKDLHGRETRSVVVITRWMDTTTPVISLVNPPRDTSVPNAMDHMEVEVSAFDSVGIDSVKINGVKLTSAPYKASVPLALGANEVEMLAWDKAGNASKPFSVTITRAWATDSVPPTITRIAPTKDTTEVGATTTSFELSWKVSDDSAVATVTLNGKAVTGAAGTYSSTQPLVEGINTFALEAKDLRGNIRRDTVHILRLTDPTKPIAIWQGDSKDTTVWAFVPSVSVTWKVTDNALKLVTINGASANKSGDLYSQTVDLATDVTWIRMMALDSSGNTFSDSIKVTRKYDKTPPTVAFQKTKSRLVANAVTADTLVWIVTDTLKLKSVKMNGADLTVSGNTYTSLVNLTVGTHRYVLVATDSAGNTTTDTAVVARTALPPTHSLSANGKYIGTAYDTLVSAGAESIEYSFNGTDWTEGNLVKATGTGSMLIYARAQPGNVQAVMAISLTQISSIAIGGNEMSGSGYALYLLPDGTVLGSGSNGSAGFGTVDGASGYNRSPPRTIATNAKWIAVTSGWGQATYIMKKDNQLIASGSLEPGQLGGSIITPPVPFQNVSVEDVSSVVVSSGTTLFLKKDGTVWTGGYSTAGSEHSDTIPVRVAGIAHVGTGAAVGNGAAVVDSSGQVWVWGDVIKNHYDTATLVASGAKAVAMGAGNTGEGHMLILNTNGTVSSGGTNDYGQLGDGSQGSGTNSFSEIPGLSNVVSIKANSNYSLFLKDNGDLLISGQLTTGFQQGDVYTKPTVIAKDVASVYPGRGGFMILKKDGTLWGAGEKVFGEEPSYESAALPRQVNF